MSSGADESVKETEQLATGDRTDAPAKDRHRGIALLVYHREGITMVPLRPDRPVVVGRAPPPEADGWAIQDPSLSRAHARFTLLGDTVAVEDLESRNGTWFRGVRVGSASLVPGDEVRLSDVPVVVHADAAPQALTRLLSHERFRLAIEDEVVRARHFHRPFALIMLRQEAKGASHVRTFYQQILSKLRPLDRIAFYSQDTLELLLPEMEPEEAVSLAEALSARVQGAAALAASLAAYPATAADAESLLAACLKALLEGKRGARVRKATAATRVSAAGDRSASDGPGVVVASAALRGIFKSAKRVARSMISILILGETGVGKEVLARRIHEEGPRRGGPFVTVNCASFPDDLIEAMLFGHERGAFTGAVRQREGLFEEAGGGTLMLDEIGDLPKHLQAVLLRVLETRRVRRVGGTKEIEVDVRVIAATHCDLQQMTKEKSFREDLLHRLDGVTLTIPPLRERQEEIEPLSLAFLRGANELNQCAIKGIEPKALDLLRRYPWPGNIRELRNAIERAVLLADGDDIAVEDLPERVRAAQGGRPAAASPKLSVPAPAAGEDDGLRDRLEAYEAQLIIEALNACEGNQKLAAEHLKLPLRTLVHKLSQLKIKRGLYEGPAQPKTPRG